MDGNHFIYLRRSTGVLSFLLLLGWVVLEGGPIAHADEPTWSPHSPSSLDYLHQGILRSDLKILGAQSCAAASCHGGPRPGSVHASVVRSNEYQMWFENDPHAQSWNTFCSPESVAMMQRLDILDADGEITDPAGYDNCLACHNSTPRCEVGTSRAITFRREGVGCSGCHGPSEQWIGTHSQDEWHEPAVSQEGYVPMNDFLARARVCASCHIGDQDRDMNHDIIAAGHPPLRYDFATYHHRQPKHWRDARSNDAWTYEAQLWLAGQIAATDASLSLLVRRTDPVAGHAWPALSSYDCSSCHHSLGFANERSPLKSLNQGGVQQAVAVASRWNDSGLRFILHSRLQNGIAQEIDYRLLDQLDQLRNTMEASATPDVAVVHEQVVELRRSISHWVNVVYRSISPSFTSADLAGLVVDAASRRESYATWESTVQLYLAAVASRTVWPGDETTFVAERLRTGLGYPDHLDTPEFEKADSGATLQRHEAAKLSIELAAWLGNVRTPDLNFWEGEQAAAEKNREKWQATIDRINETLRQKQTKRQETQPNAQPNALPNAMPNGLQKNAPEMPVPDKAAPLIKPDTPEPKVKSRQELLDELRKRQSDALNNPFGND
ncbi:cytochrome c family protein [Neorhodopirellula pilleata]|uniref:Cytochrome c-552/4 domain-containing protein n=1 Tax=Neorhodopirellula pilleata TaxID=2714738 RepID=A0A5C6AXH8_9BACT|nr:cytochrome c family protein [Neorhodopirellula pilleata]TWU03752.1 hypothetical protein Pla100_06820 [Neorhodopirellula pilleata]